MLEPNQDGMVDPSFLGILTVSESKFNSFLASWWQDTLFFAILGVPALLLSSLNPSKQDFSARLAWLFSGRHKTPGMADHLATIVRRSAAAANQGSIDINISAYDPQIDAYKIGVRIELNLCNLLANDDYEDEMSVNMRGDDVAPPDGVAGAIETFEISKRLSKNSRGLPQPLATNLPVVLRLGDKNYIHADGKLKIQADECVHYVCSFWHWSKVGIPFSVGVNRFTENLSVHIQHDCSTPDGAEAIRFSLDHPTTDGQWSDLGFKDRILRRGRAAQIAKHRDVYSGQRIRLIFDRPEADKMQRALLPRRPLKSLK